MKENPKQLSVLTILRLAFYAACILLPAAGLYLGLDYFSRNHKALVQNAQAAELNNIAAELSLAADQEKFWIKNLTEIFSVAQTTAELSDNLQSFLDKAGTSGDFIIYDDVGNSLTSNLKDARQLEAWQKAGPQLHHAKKQLYGKGAFTASKVLADIFGPDFYMPLRGTAQSLSATSFYKSNVISQDHLFWYASSDNHLLLIRLPGSELKKKTGLQLYFKDNLKNRFETALFINDKLQSSDLSPSIAKLAFNSFKKNALLDIQLHQNRLLKVVQLDNNLWCVIGRELPLEKIKVGQLTVFLTMLAIFTLALFVKNGYLPARPEDMPLIAQIMILMAITSGIPLGALCLISLSYFNSKKSALINENFHQMRTYVEYLKNQVQVEHSRITRVIKKAVDESKETLSGDLNTLPHVRSFNRRLENKFSTGYLVKEDQYINIKAGLPRRNENKTRSNNSGGDLNQSKVERSNALAFGGYFLASVNETAKPDIPFEKAYMLEMFFQKPLPMFIQELMGFEGLLIPTGWGNEKLLLFNQAFKLATDNFYDLYAFIVYIPWLVERDFFIKHMPQIQQNPFGYRILIATINYLLNEDAPLIEFPEENRLFKNISATQQTEPRFIHYSDEPHLFYGQKGILEDKELFFCAVFPMAEIHGQIKREAGDFAYMAIFAILILSTMIVVLYLNLIMPVKKLHQAAEALEERNASFRLTADSKDEFGEMAEIFNQSISELDELNIASLVQARLLPAKAMLSDNFSLYGKSIPMADLGGDYFDYFAIDEGRFAMMLGDVAGHGVGAALIMAIAKSGVIISENLAADPAAILTKLHQIILATKTKQQRKVMTFQYLVVDKNAGKATYANAGGCSPVLIDSNKGTITEIKHGGGVLGGFKKNNISNIDFSIEPGQAVIFYTDGMVESRNHTGRELGYQGLYDIFLSSYNEDAEKFYQQINTTYQQWLNGCEVGDDLTILVMTCRHSPCISEEQA